MRRRMSSLMLAATLFAVGACGQVEEQEDVVTTDEPTGSASHEPQATAAVADLAERRGVSADEVQVVAVEEVTWRDGSLGCAEKGMAYTQALVPGSRITLEVAGERVEYHAGGGRGPFLCEEPTQ